MASRLVYESVDAARGVEVGESRQHRRRAGQPQQRGHARNSRQGWG